MASCTIEIDVEGTRLDEELLLKSSGAKPFRVRVPVLPPQTIRMKMKNKDMIFSIDMILTSTAR